MNNSEQHKRSSKWIFHAEDTDASPAGRHNEFSLDMYRQLYSESGNLFFSPLSVRTSLAITLAGARGATAEQIRSTLRFLPKGMEDYTAMAEILQRLNLSDSDAYELCIANGLWSQKGETIEQDFLTFLKHYFESEVNTVDFAANAESARKEINRWVQGRTQDKIPELIPPNGVEKLTRLVLTNAVYFNGRWKKEFQVQSTRPAPFTRLDGSRVSTRLMYDKREVPYVSGPGFQAVELEYKGNDIFMLIMLPDLVDGFRAMGKPKSFLVSTGLQELQQHFSSRFFNACIDRLQKRSLELYLPRFQFSWGTSDLRQNLEDLGMKSAFNQRVADFSGINAQEPGSEKALHLSNVFHKSFINVNEKGTEAAVATAPTLRLLSANPPVPVFCADHPFVFALYDRSSRSILFLGRLNDPSA